MAANVPPADDVDEAFERHCARFRAQDSGGGDDDVDDSDDFEDDFEGGLERAVFNS